jgi:hypothetical protein
LFAEWGSQQGGNKKPGRGSTGSGEKWMKAIKGKACRDD